MSRAVCTQHFRWRCSQTIYNYKSVGNLKSWKWFESSHHWWWPGFLSCRLQMHAWSRELQSNGKVYRWTIWSLCCDMNIFRLPFFGCGVLSGISYLHLSHLYISCVQQYYILAKKCKLLIVIQVQSFTIAYTLTGIRNNKIKYELLIHSFKSTWNHHCFWCRCKERIFQKSICNARPRAKNITGLNLTDFNLRGIKIIIRNNCQLVSHNIIRFTPLHTTLRL